MAKPQSLDPQTLSQVQTALGLARKGDLGGARRIAEQALERGKDQPTVQGLLGMLCCQAGDLKAGIPHLQAAHLARPEDVGVASNLVMALTEVGDSFAALTICTATLADQDPTARLWRMRGYLLQQGQDFPAAARAYEHVVQTVPGDFESWNNLGNARAACGDIDGSIMAIEHAIALRPDVAPIRLNLATTLLEAGRLEAAIGALQACVQRFPEDAKAWHELSALFKQAGQESDSLDALERAAALSPADADMQVALGMERVNGWTMDGAEDAFLKAVAIDPSHAEAHILLGLLLEHTNRYDELPQLVLTAEERNVEASAVSFINALACRREKRFIDGLEALANVPDHVEPIRSAQMRGQFHDRLGVAEAAFAAFVEMNRQQGLDPTDPTSRAKQYRENLSSDRALLTAQWYGGWTPPSLSSDRPSPVFLVGFPRSGTTLLDTMLMGHPNVQVMEERPPLTQVELALGSLERLATLDEVEISRLRDVYFKEVENWLPGRKGVTIVDKFPLHLNKVPIIHRLFPDAKFILALRHPCDVVLSCFITNFRLNNAMANFIDLNHTAWVYDQSFGFWEQSCAIMPIQTHIVRYEQIVADSEGTLRPLFDYLNLPWHDQVLDHRHTAANRGIISTASYAQVTEPIYDRSSGRWVRYREQLAPVIPVLSPWITHYGYDI